MPDQRNKKAKKVKTKLHPRNRNREKYDLKALTISNPALINYIRPNKVGIDTIDFANPIAVKLLNKALLDHYYGIAYWEFSDDNLCPPIPGRADYIHYLADLLSENNEGVIPKGDQITCLDIGVGASCIYPIIGAVEYDWNFIGSETDQKSMESAQTIVHNNPSLRDKVIVRLQRNPKHIFRGIINKEDKMDLVICNPPFHASKEEAMNATRRKIRNLSGKNLPKPKLNFSGRSNELTYEGGEYQFIQNIIAESQQFAKHCFWFSTLVSKQSNLKGIYKSLERIKCNQVKTIPMGTANKTSRIVAWTFLSKTEKKEWSIAKWRKLER